MIEAISEAIKLKYPDEIEEFQPCTMISQEPIFITGRICCDQGGGVGRLNAQSVLLQGDKYISNGKQISIDLNHIEEYTLFPGQVTPPVSCSILKLTFKFSWTRRFIAVPWPGLCDAQVS